MSVEYYYEEQQDQNQNKEEKKCEKYNKFVDEIYYSSCKHSTCLDCLLANFISCNFKGLYANQNILSCPICNEGNLYFQSNQDLINALNKSIENKHENYHQSSQNSKKGC